MITLLPEQGRAAVFAEYRIRYAALICVGVGIIALGTGALLAPAYLEARVRKEAAEIESERLLAMKQVSESAIPQIQELLTVFSEVEAAGLSSVVLEDVLTVRPSGVRISRVLFTSGNGELILTGEASSREVLLSYANMVEGVLGVLRYSLPLSNLAKSEQAPFSLSVYLEQTKKQ